MDRMQGFSSLSGDEEAERQERADPTIPILVREEGPMLSPLVVELGLSFSFCALLLSRLMAHWYSGTTHSAIPTPTDTPHRLATHSSHLIHSLMSINSPGLMPTDRHFFRRHS